MQVRELFRATLGSLYAFVARRAGGERELVEDVVQETWLRAVAAWRGSPSLPREPLAWLKTVARRLLLNHFRTQRRRPTVPLHGVLDSLLAPTPSERPAASALVPWALARIDDDDATLLEAFHLDGCSTRELAAARRTTERAIEGRLRRGRERMRAVLARIEDDPALPERLRPANGDAT
jgi:RNA polymerase sigma-70 factor (ECF subfamily)